MSHENRHRVIEWGIQIWMAFIVFNATVVFGQGAIRTFGLAVTLWLVTCVIWRRASEQRMRTEPGPEHVVD